MSPRSWTELNLSNARHENARGSTLKRGTRRANARTRRATSNAKHETRTHCTARRRPPDFAEYSIWPPPPERRHFLTYLQPIARPKDIPVTVYTGTLGLAGKSAWTAYETFAKEKTKEVRPARGEGNEPRLTRGVLGQDAVCQCGRGRCGNVRIEEAARVTDELMRCVECRFVCEYAKVLNPSIKVIGSAGSQEKLDVLKKIGVDVTINYKTQDTAAILKEHGPIDMCVSCFVLWVSGGKWR